MFKKFNHILIVGFGASCLNLRALLSAVSIHKKFFHFLDTLDPVAVEEITSKIDLQNTAVVFISKSGNTQEMNLLLEHFHNLPHIFILSSNKDSHMKRIARNIKHQWIDYPDAISGRFALLTRPFLDIANEVIDTDKITRAASDIDKKHAMNIAQKWMNNFENGKRNWVIISYSRQIQGLLLWLRQIISESLGKNGFGIMPILAEGSMDEHSQLQLFLDGPDDKFYDIISSKNLHHKDIKLAESQLEHAVMVEKMLLAKGLDVTHNCYDNIDEIVIGDYIGTYIEVVRIIADKLGVDPYNQPAVEDIKQKVQSNET